MVKQKVDSRVRTLIENGIATGHRSLIVLVGDKSRDQVVYMHHMLSKSSMKQASVLWCYKKDLGFSGHRKKRLRQLVAKKKTGWTEINEDDPFEMFVNMAEIRYCFYKETHKILGNTYKMCVLQDFEALTPNILCRTIETVEGGGIVAILLHSMTSLRQLYTMNMDVHARYRTESHQHVVPRFNERFILSLSSCNMCVVMDDQLRILPVSSHLRDLQPVPAVTPLTPLSPNDQELKDLKLSLKDSPPIGILVGLCKTLDQAKAVLQFILAITEKTLRTTATLTAGRGRGKSAALGLAMAGAIAFGYSNIFVTSPSPENLRTLFEFVIKGLDAMNYEEHLSYQVLRSSDEEYSNCVMRITVTRDRRQIIQYIAPGDNSILGQAELVVIDEAAAIPLPLVRSLLGPYLVFLSSTVSGYEGTGRSLSLKLIDQLRTQSKKTDDEDDKSSALGRVLHEMTLEESIRYKSGDPVEKWLHHLLCLEASVPSLPTVMPPASECQLFYVNRDALFGYHKVSEKFLSQVMSLLVSSHYRNSPDDMQALSDAPAHHLYVLVPPQNESNCDSIPPVLAVIQVSLEGKISKDSVMAALAEGVKPSGDMVPWTVSNQYQNLDFPQLSGARIIRIATHPGCQGQGYGSQAMSLLEKYFSASSIHADILNKLTPEVSHKVVKDNQVGLLEEQIGPDYQTPPLLQSLSERKAEALHYLSVSYGATPQLLTFWKRCGFTPVYLSQVCNNITGEHTIIMLKVLSEAKEEREKSWLGDLWFDFRKRMVVLLGYAFKKYDAKFALNIISSSIYKKKEKVISLSELDLYITSGDLKRLSEFLNHMCESALIADILPSFSKLFFLSKITDFKLRPVKAAILCGVGIQRKTPQVVASELGVEPSIVLSQVRELITDITKYMKKIRASALKGEADGSQEVDLGVVEDLTTTIEKTAKRLKKKQAYDREQVTQILDVNEYELPSKQMSQREKEEIESESQTKKNLRLLETVQKKMKVK